MRLSLNAEQANLMFAGRQVAIYQGSVRTVHQARSFHQPSTQTATVRHYCALLQMVTEDGETVNLHPDDAIELEDHTAV